MLDSRCWVVFFLQLNMNLFVYLFIFIDGCVSDVVPLLLLFLFI